MSTVWVLVTISNIVTPIFSQLGDLTCDESTWTATYSAWNFGSGCQIENTGVVSGSFAWIGNSNTDSLTWETYTAEMIMTPAPGYVGNGGLAFHIQTPGTGENSGNYYAFAFLNLVVGNPITAVIAKFSNSYSTEKQWNTGLTYVDGNSYHLKVEVDSEPLIKAWLNNNYLGSWTDTISPYTYGSVGARNWMLPQIITEFCVNSCATRDPTSSPTTNPSNTPTENPSHMPTTDPTPSPTFTPTSNPSYMPTTNPSNTPTENPSHMPTTDPSNIPTSNPSPSPTFTPTSNPSHMPTIVPSSVPSLNPSNLPTITPTLNPTLLPTTSNPSTYKLQTTKLLSSTNNDQQSDNNNIGSNKTGNSLMLIIFINIAVCAVIILITCVTIKKKRIEKSVKEIQYPAVQSAEFGQVVHIHKETDIYSTNPIAMERVNSTSPAPDSIYDMDVVGIVRNMEGYYNSDDIDDVNNMVQENDFDIVNEINTTTAGYPAENDDIDDINNMAEGGGSGGVSDVNMTTAGEDDFEIVNDADMTTTRHY